MTSPRRVLRVALTGGIATGKSYCLNRISAAGIPVIDADALAREAVRPGTPGHHAVVLRFGPGIVGPTGDINRAALGRIVFSDAAARKDLEAIIHPEVFHRIEAWFERLDRAAAVAARDHGGAHGLQPLSPPLGVADVPLLFETDAASRFDRVIVVACPDDVAVARIIARDRLSEPDARRRLTAQWPIDDKRARGDEVIDTSGSFADTNRQIDAVVSRLRAWQPNRSL